MTRTKINTGLVQIARAIKALEKKTIQNVVEIGKLLHQASEKCEHGEYAAWLKSEFEWSDQTALNYRYVFKLTQKPNNLDFAKLDISISAVYFVAGILLREDQCPEDRAAAKAVIAAAKKDRVTYPIATIIFNKHLADHRPAEEPDDLPDEEPDDLPDEEPDTEEPLDDDTESEQPPPSKLAATVREMLDISEHDSAWPDIIADIGTAALQKIIRTLQAVYDARCEISSVKAAADRAEGRGVR
jgi:Protein of unknown function (DUF3102)